jgi:tripartite-type tricarboxylate transporter receptor subunit TctC
MKSIGLVLAALMIATGARAADYPTKPINIIVPFAAGGSNDIVARAIGKGLADAWGQPVVIDNRAGAGGVIGAEAVARAPNDGHTILLVSSTFKTRSVVKRGSDLPLDPAGVIVLDPQLRMVLFNESFDHLAALRGLLSVGVEVRNFLVRDLFRIVIEIAR